MILLDATPLQSEHRFRGVGYYVRELTKALFQHAPDVIRFVGTSQDRELLPPWVRERSHLGFRPHRPAQVYWLYNEPFLRRTLHKVRPDLFHATDFNGVVQLSRLPTVATVYDLTALKMRQPARTASAYLSQLRWQAYYQKLRKVDHLIAISETVRRDLVELLHIPADRITTIPLGVDTERFRPLRGVGPYANTPPYLLYVGAPDANKNIGRILKAFDQVAKAAPSLHLFLAGNWRKEGQAWLETQCQHLAFGHKVRHLGFIPDEDLPGLYANALAFVFPSLEEGFGMPVVEAMACGTPVITSNRGSLREVAEDAAWLVTPEALEDLAAALISIVRSSEVREELAARGLQRAQAFSWQAVARNTWGVYEEVLSATPRS
ncbi:MAG: glycosyltransferase family 4 protein [Acidithiobacillus sp.]|nr:glycosyltransferase family 4 protein [Acidithiobacillus sp.]